MLCDTTIGAAALVGAYAVISPIRQRDNDGDIVVFGVYVVIVYVCVLGSFYYKQMHEKYKLTKKLLQKFKTILKIKDYKVVKDCIKEQEKRNKYNKNCKVKAKIH